MILAIRYKEPEYQKTVECLNAIERQGVKVAYVDRNPEGIGSLSEAINRGFREHWDGSEFVWVITNIQFDAYLYKKLINEFKNCPHVSAICPCYQSDHNFLQPSSFKWQCNTIVIPFIEFTAPMIRASVLKEFPLDEDMPYVGMDLDWSYRVKQAGHTLAVDYATSIEHKYIRHSSKTNPITKQRLKMRKLADKPTIKALESKHGKDWRNILNYHSGIASK
jgi:GT2 family glycosyltransferase